MDQSHSLSQFYSLNFMEESMSYLEKTARKLMPILAEIKRRMVPEKRLKEKVRRPSAIGKAKIETLDSVHEELLTEEENVERTAADMKNILGYLN
jgi:hypothetical protein